MGNIMKEILNNKREMEKEYIIILMEMYMKEIGPMIRGLEREKSYSKMIHN